MRILSLITYSIMIIVSVFRSQGLSFSTIMNKVLFEEDIIRCNIAYGFDWNKHLHEQTVQNLMNDSKFRYCKECIGRVPKLRLCKNAFMVEAW